jgi:hypothetical protein
MLKNIFLLSIELRGNKEKRPYAERDFVPLDFDVMSPASQGGLSFEKFPDFEPVFSDVILTAPSTDVDFITNWGAIQGRGYIVSENVKKVFSAFQLPPHRFYSLKIFHPKKGILKTPPFYWIQVLHVPYLENINFKLSSIEAVKDIYEDTETRVVVKSCDELKSYIDQGMDYSIFYEKLVFNETMSYDLFFAPDLEMNAMISGELKKALEESGVKGYSTFNEPKIFRS